MSGVRRLVLDCETDGLLRQATKIFCVVTQDLDTDEVITFTDSKKFERYIGVYSEIWMHNGIAFDAPILKKIWGIEIPWYKMYDTIILSRMLLPDRKGGHSLASWGEELGYPKLHFTDFTKLTEEMITYCKRDVEITAKLAEYFFNDAKKFKLAVDIDREFAYYMSLQEYNGFTLDIPFTEELVSILTKERVELVDKVQSMIPDVNIKPILYRTAQKEGRLLYESVKDFTYITQTTKIVKTKAFIYQKINPNSRQQIANYFLEEYNWKPAVFTEKGSPDLSEKVMMTLSFPEARILSRISRLTKQLGMLIEGNNGWMKKVEIATSKVYGSVVVNGATGGRCTHRNPNLSQCDRKDLRMRECWVTKKGWALVDCDAAGLELRMLAHYLHNWDDGKYARVILEEDIHSYNQNIIGLNYRDSAKTFIYANIYGAGDVKLGEIVCKDSENPVIDIRIKRAFGKKARARVKDNIIGYKQVLDLIKNKLLERGHIYGIDGRPLIPRNHYSALNLLLQSGGASVMKLALNNFMRMAESEGLIIGTDFGLCANIHDEFIIECPHRNTKTVSRLSKKSIELTTQQLDLNILMEGDSRVGSTWRDIH